MKIIITMDLNDDEKAEFGDTPDFEALSPNEVGTAVIAFYNSMNSKGQVEQFELILPWFNDDTQDICDVIKRDQSPLKISTLQLRNMNIIFPPA